MTTPRLQADHVRELVTLARLAGELDAARDRADGELRQRLAVASDALRDAITELQATALGGRNKDNG